MITPDQTLHDFVLTLLTDDAARSAFAADPGQCLSAAGLDDITATDVQDVIPLVVDYAPAGLDLTLLADASALDQLQAFAEAAGGLSVGADGVTGAFAGGYALTSDSLVSGGTVAASTDGVAAAFAGESDLGAVDGDLAASTDGVAAAFLGQTDHGAVGADLIAGADGAAGSFGVESDTVAAGADFAASTDGVAGGAGLASDLATADGGVAASTDGVAAGFSGSSSLGSVGAESAMGLDGGAGSVALDSDVATAGAGLAASTHGVDAGLALDSDLLSIDGDLTVATSGAAGGIDLAVAGVDAPELAVPQLGGLDDVTGLLDADALRAGDVTVGTVANYVTSGGDLSAVDLPAVGGLVPDLGQLPADLPVDLPAVPALPELDDLPVDVPSVGDLPVDLPVDLPAAGDLPVEVPEVGDLPIQLPELGSLPIDLPELPVELPVDLPVANPLPDLGALPQTAGDLVSGTPLGKVTGEGGLLDVGGVTDTLGLDG